MMAGRLPASGLCCARLAAPAGRACLLVFSPAAASPDSGGTNWYEMGSCQLELATGRDGHCEKLSLRGRLLLKRVLCYVKVRGVHVPEWSRRNTELLGHVLSIRSRFNVHQRTRPADLLASRTLT